MLKPGWKVDTITEDKRPTAIYRCASCHTDTYFDLSGNGKVPDPKCCTNREPFPVEFYPHLSLRPKPAAMPWQAVTIFGGETFGNKVARLLGNLSRSK